MTHPLKTKRLTCDTCKANSEYHGLTPYLAVESALGKGWRRFLVNRYVCPECPDPVLGPLPSEPMEDDE